MGIGVKRNKSQAQLGWTWGSSPEIGGSQGRPGWGAAGSGRRSGSSQRAPGRSAELGPAVEVSLGSLSSSPDTSWRVKK